MEGAGSGDELLIYFSGHGVEWDGHRLLIPQDFDPADPSRRDDLIGDLDLYAMARSRQCAADSVVLVIDACRQDIRLKVVDNKGPDTESAAGDAQSPSIAFLYSCGTDELSHATKGADPHSYFTRALCEALKADDTLETIADLRAAIQERLSATLHPISLHQTVTPGELRAAGRGGDPERLVVKESPGARLRQQIERSDWVRRATHGPIWELAAGASEALADQLRTLIQRCEALYREARKMLPRQRWGDDKAPARVLRCLEILQGDGTASLLRPAEAAVVLLIPHLYEALLAAAQINLLKHGDPLAANGYGPSACRMALALRNRIASEAAWERRRALLRSRALDDAADDLAAWQMLRFLHESGELWDYSPGRPAGTRGWANEALDALFAPAPLPTVAAEPKVPRVLDGTRLVGLVRLAFAGFEDIRLEAGREAPQGLERRRCFGQGQGRELWCLDELKLAHLLNLAFGMALDPRRMPPVLAEHLGVDAKVSAESLAETLSGAEWQRDSKDALILALDCPHEALDAALETHVDQLAEHLYRLAREQVLESDLLDRLPRRIADSRVRPVRDGDGPRYQRPHLAFSMDQGRVRELLMGETLYGKPELALRELYQNALDACRYRRTRERWLRATGRLDDRTPVYSGQIRFRAGTECGRAYIECEDNGIGMTERHLRGLFARAGRRFADSHEFHLEQADWDAAGIPFHPNSRFGIGVLSYFMLADELLVESRRLKHDGVDWEPGIRARVVGSGSLFRLQPLREPRQGTRVRLYLNKTDSDPASLLDGMTEWLWVPEFDTEIAGSSMLRLAAGEPGPGMSKECGTLVAIPESKGDACQVRAWWSVGIVQSILTMLRKFGYDARHIKYLKQEQTVGYLLADGIRVSTQDDWSAPGLVVNLTETLRPGLSVDRNRIIDCSVGEDWLRGLLVEHGWRRCLDIADLGLFELGALFLVQPLAVARLDSRLRDGEPAQRQVYWDSQGTVKIDSGVGLFKADASLDPRPSIEWRPAFGARGCGKTTAGAMLRAPLRALMGAGLALPPPLARLYELPWAVEHFNPPVSAWTLVTRYLPTDEKYNESVAPDKAPITLSAGLARFALDRSMTIAEAIKLARGIPALGIEPDMWDRIPMT